MYISTKDWMAFVRKLSKLNQSAADAVSAYVTKNGFADTARLIEYCYGVANKYGTASSSLAALMYDTVSELEGAFYPVAEIADVISYGDVAKAVRGTLKSSQNPEEIGGAVARLVKRAGQDTLLNNAIRDGAQFAWIPSGDSCAFCAMIASNGWQYASKDALNGGHADHIHANCDCTYMIRHSPKTNVRGYDPSKYKAMYDDADGYGWRQKVNAMRRENYAKNADEINAQKREAYAQRMHPRTESFTEETDG